MRTLQHPTVFPLCATSTSSIRLLDGTLTSDSLFLVDGSIPAELTLTGAVVCVSCPHPVDNWLMNTEKGSALHDGTARSESEMLRRFFVFFTIGEVCPSTSEVDKPFGWLPTLGYKI